MNRVRRRTVRLIVLVLSLGALSCQAVDMISAPLVANRSATKTATPPPTPTAATPTASPTVQVLPSPTATNTPTNCADNSSTFVSDVTVPDGTVIAPNQTFTKTWRLKNPPGKCAWGSGYQLAFVSGSAMAANTAVDVPDTAAGETADLSVPMTAPGQPGNYSGVWRLRSPRGALFGTTMSIKILVSGTPVATVPAATSKPQVAAARTQVSTPGSPASTSVPAPSAAATVKPSGPTTVTRSATGGNESGTVYDSFSKLPVDLGKLLAGDTSTNHLARAFMSFDISDLGGRVLIGANLDLTGCTITGSPFANLNGIWVGELQYPLPLSQSAYSLPSSGFLQLKSMPTGSIDVKSFVQNRVSQRKARFQIRLHPGYPTSNGDSKPDYIACGAGVPKLSLTY